jgi:predicted RNA-binding protein with PUA-like domain
MRHWILQANPRGYRLFDALRDGYEISSWSVAHLRDEIAAGDEFALWVSGEERGVYALGVVTERAEYRQDDDPYWTDPADASTPTWQVGIRLRQTLIDRPVLGEDLAEDPRFANALILRMPGGRNPFRLTEDEWHAILSRCSPNTAAVERPSRNPPWSRDERLLALDLYLHRRPRLPGAEDREVRELSAFLNSLPIHTVRPDLETFRNPNGVSLKLANFAASTRNIPAQECVLLAAPMPRSGTGTLYIRMNSARLSKLSAPPRPDQYFLTFLKPTKKKLRQTKAACSPGYTVSGKGIPLSSGARKKPHTKPAALFRVRSAASTSPLPTET